MSYLESLPTLREIAERLSFVARWNGRTTMPWSVLQHTILTGTLLPEDATSYYRLVVLMHDAAEGWTGDIPRPFKCPEQAKLEEDILAEIYNGMDIVAPGMHVKKLLRYVDDIAAVVEAQCICRPEQRRYVVAKHLENHAADTALVEQGEETLWRMRDLSREDAVHLWVWAVGDLIQELLERE